MRGEWRTIALAAILAILVLIGTVYGITRLVQVVRGDCHVVGYTNSGEAVWQCSGMSEVRPTVAEPGQF